MTMTYELITPEWAKMMLETHNGNNRNISRATVEMYAREMRVGNWDSEVGAAISIDDNGILRDGQHRLAAVVKAQTSVRMWVCRGVSERGIYDNNRKRSARDQVSILRPDFDKVYSSTLYIAVATMLIDRMKTRRRISAKEVIEFTEAHKEDLDTFFSVFSTHTIRKISISVVFCAMYMAFCSGVNINKLKSFYEILSTGMSTEKESFPIIAYRNYLYSSKTQDHTLDNIKRCQYAIKNFLLGNGNRKSIVPITMIYPFPYNEEDNADV